MREQYITIPAASTGGTCTSRAWVRNMEQEQEEDLIFIIMMDHIKKDSN